MNWNSAATTTKITEKAGYSGPGFYRIRLMKEGDPVEIPRFGGVEEKGIISIGESKNIEDRRNAFLRSKDGGSGHSEGNTLWAVMKFSDRFNGGKQYSFLMDFIKTSSKSEAKEMERKAIKNYFKEFQEVPPLNLAFPKRNEWIKELREETK